LARVVFSEESFSDFERILDFLYDNSPAHATEALNTIRSAVESLDRHPLLGRRVDGEIRELVISWGKTGYLALYRFDAPRNIVRTLGIRHQREAGYTD
jgi:plasmid stabilization system protein ParE